jgi:hypothetical protein
LVVHLARNFDGVRVSTDDWPVILMDFDAGIVPDPALNDSLAYLEQLYTEARRDGARTFTITDLSRTHQLALANQRKVVSEWMTRTLQLQKAVCLGGAIVTPSTILRGLVTAIYWLVPPPVPSTFVATRREAYSASIKAFDAAGVLLSPALHEALKARG